jgi:hypothetical protein
VYFCQRHLSYWYWSIPQTHVNSKTHETLTRAGRDGAQKTNPREPTIFSLNLYLGFETLNP